MGVHYSKHMLHHLLLVALLIASTSSDPNCPNYEVCGNVKIPFPFSTTQACSLNASFLITCNTTFSPPIPFLNINNNSRPVRVLGISLDGELNISLPVAEECVNRSTGETINGGDVYSFDLTPFHLSSKRNMLTAVGTDISGVIRSKRESDACMSWFSYQEITSSCSGHYCCQTEIPQKLSSFWYYAQAHFYNYNGTLADQLASYPPCGYAFLVEKESFQFSNFITKNKIKIKLNTNTTFPVVVDWAVGYHTCQHAQKNSSSYACKSNHSKCYDVKGGHGYGYRCKCSPGFRGNPYLQDGCQDIDECKETSHDCWKKAQCTNTIGNYSCHCPRGYKGDGRNKGTSCTSKDKSDLIIVITLSVSGSILTLLGVTFYAYCFLKKRKFIKLKAQFFQQNGGLFLQQQIAKYNGSKKMTEVFTIEELKEATNNFDKGMIIGQGGQGTVYKGIFPDNKIVAIKKSIINNSNQVEHFINEVIMLSQINHRNVVKLLGCCLETEVPLLVYEFIPNGTVYDHLHDQSQTLRLTWKTRLRIATETAQALAYLHSATSTPIIHRDVKTVNILLDHNLVAKVADFGASRTIPLDQSQVTTLVQGTLGYLDPEYFRTSQLTEKSDVYSFGVVLIELVTGKKALCFDGPKDHRNLVMCFDSLMKEGQLVNIVDRHIIDEASIEQLMKVANIASHCLRLKGEERPAMREVAMQLEGICGVDKHQWENTNLSSAETEEVLDPTPYAADIAGGDGGRGNTSSSFDIINQISMSLNNGR